jgi:hypothetical protein
VVLFPGKSRPNNGRAASLYVDILPMVTRGMDDPKNFSVGGYSPWVYFPILPKKTLNESILLRGRNMND